MTSDDPQYYIKGVLEGDRRVIAKTITLIESSLPRHQDLSTQILDDLLPNTGKSIRLGITGVPGVGKSTFIENFGMELIQKGHRLGVLAVDPSSKKSGGSIMGDKTRMEKLSVHEQAFIRPSPSGGTLGGVARKTRETMIICEAAGFDVIIVETIGVGQSEIMVASMVDFFLVLMLAGAGDELQGIKKGVLELADAIAINKADGDNIKRTQQAKREYEAAMGLLYHPSPVWSPPVLTCSALTKDGLEQIWNIILDHRKKLSASGELTEKRKQQALDWMWSLVEEGLRDQFKHNPSVKKRLAKITGEVEKGVIAPTSAAAELLELMHRP
ncbi:MAG: methylmalonyl Co-A mutase-associated GTPase MeaB [Desulfobacterales bacterium]|jgi:LAO/AO transport system kinase